MDLTQLFTRQKELDDYIEQKHGLTSKDLFEEKILALFVEIGELANETRCFKFWSVKEPSPKEVILEEYVDGIHFLLSLGLERGLTPKKAEPFEQETTTTALFNQMYRAIDYFKDQQNEETYLIVFELYLKLARQLGFTDDDILTAYHDKNDVNFKRQDSNY
jgi:dimeric dUTPase (all-alpha-NTP-PPase superfamily)